MRQEDKTSQQAAFPTADFLRAAAPAVTVKDEEDGDGDSGESIPATKSHVVPAGQQATRMMLCPAIDRASPVIRVLLLIRLILAG